MDIDNVPFDGVLFICRRNSTPVATTKERKFKAKCGSKVTLVIARDGTINKVEFGRECCKDGCLYCDVMVLDAKKIVENA